MTAYEKQTGSSEYSTSDQACMRCRERKIRCGREIPQCNNCARSDGVTCVYQNTVKRVNHLKSLFDSVSGVHNRLNSIESSLGRLTISIARLNLDENDRCSNSSSRQASASRQDFEDDDNEDDDSRSETPSPPGDKSTDLHVFQNQVDVTDCYHGPSSLFVLCNQFRSCALATKNATECGAPLRDMLQNLCDNAGTIEPFPPFNNKPIIDLPPKQQIVTAIGHFFQHVDSTTNIFVKSNLLANIERIYSQPTTEPGDDIWAICFKAITLLALGIEISAQGSNALFGDFAYSFLPSRAALVNSHLLTMARLINIQTLILLSVAAQQFDPPGWAELLFTYACILARTMGLQHTQLSPPDTSANEIIERAKVVQSLYSRDKSLCITRGTTCWLPSYDCSIAPQLSANIKRQAAYSDRFQLAMIQDDIYCLTYAHNSNAKPQAAQTLQSIEKRLNQYASAFGIFNSQASYYNSPRRAMVPLEFLSTRIIALQHGTESRHTEQVRSDAKASCLLLLMAHGAQECEVMDAFNSLTGYATSSTPQNITEASTISFASILDFFSIPAFFILLKGLLQPPENDDNSQSDADLDLLRKVSACYTNSTARMQANSFHRKVAWSFEQLLATINILKHPKQYQTAPVTLPTPMSEMMACNSDNPSDFSFPPLPSESTSFSWENWSSAPSSFEENTSFDSASSMGVSRSAPGLLTQLVNSGQTMIAGKRARPDEESDNISAKKNASNARSEFMVPHEEMSFDF